MKEYPDTLLRKLDSRASAISMVVGLPFAIWTRSITELREDARALLEILEELEPESSSEKP